jgi:hypothetical protein
VTIDTANTDWLKEVLFGGRPWILYCDEKGRGKSSQLPAVFQESASQLKGIASFGRLDCWQRTASGKTLAHRFDFPKPPVMFAVANGNPPMLLDFEGMTKPWQLRRKAQTYLGAEVTRIDSSETFKSACTSRRACVVVGFKTATMLSETLSVLQPLLQEHRGVRAVSVDTSVWKVKMDKKLVETKPKRKEGHQERSYIVCLVRSDPQGKSGKSRTGSQSRAGAFFRLTGDASPTTENLENFLDQCNRQKNLVGMAEVPKISLRPPEQPKPRAAPKNASSEPLYEANAGKASGKTTEPLYEAKAGKASGKAAPKGTTSKAKAAETKKKPMPRYSGAPQQKSGNGKAFGSKKQKLDKVGSRESLPDDEPLFSAVQEDDGEAFGEGAEDDAAEDDSDDIEEVEL